MSSIPTESLILDGMGPPTKWTGMSRSPFRPSDDATTFPYLIPAQAMTVVELRHLGEMISDFLASSDEEEDEISQEHQRRMIDLARSGSTKDGKGSKENITACECTVVVLSAYLVLFLLSALPRNWLTKSTAASRSSASSTADRAGKET